MSLLSCCGPGMRSPQLRKTGSSFQTFKWYPPLLSSPQFWVLLALGTAAAGSLVSAQPSFRLLLPPVFSNLLKMCYSVNPSRVPYCLEGGKQRERKEKKCQPPQGPSTLGNSNHRENAECGCSSQGCSQGPSQSKTQATRNLFLLPDRLSGKPKCVCKTRN